MLARISGQKCPWISYEISKWLLPIINQERITKLLYEPQVFKNHLMGLKQSSIHPKYSLLFSSVCICSSIPPFLVLAALQLSVQDTGKDSTSQTDMSKLLTDQTFVSSILASVCDWTLTFPKSKKEKQAQAHTHTHKREEMEKWQMRICCS